MKNYKINQAYEDISGNVGIITKITNDSVCLFIVMKKTGNEPNLELSLDMFNEMLPNLTRVKQYETKLWKILND